MGEVISLAKARAERSGPREAGRSAATGAATFYFALDCPLSYVTAERIERVLGEIRWVPVLATPPADAGPSTRQSERVRGALLRSKIRLSQAQE